MQTVTELDAAIAYTRAWNRLDCTGLVQMIAPDACYASQWVFEELQSKDAIENYLAAKIAAVRNSKTRVTAELGKTTISFPDRDCVVLSQDSKDTVNAAVLFQVDEGWIKRFDLCIPALLRPVRSGQFPS